MIQQKFYEEKSLDELRELQKTTHERLLTITFVIDQKAKEALNPPKV